MSYSWLGIKLRASFTAELTAQSTIFLTCKEEKPRACERLTIIHNSTVQTLYNRNSTQKFASNCCEINLLRYIYHSNVDRLPQSKKHGYFYLFQRQINPVDNLSNTNHKGMKTYLRQTDCWACVMGRLSKSKHDIIITTLPSSHNFNLYNQINKLNSSFLPLTCLPWLYGSQGAYENLWLTEYILQYCQEIQNPVPPLYKTGKIKMEKEKYES